MSAENEELYSLLIPLAEDRLIVPRACVAEVVRFTAPEKEAGAHDFGNAGARHDQALAGERHEQAV